MSLEAIQQWLQGPGSQSVSIWCADPETSTEKSSLGIGQKSFQTYRILYKQPGRDIVSVRHRYSEFETVRKSLRDRYLPLGILVPSLPPKNSFTALAINATMSSASKLDTFFIKERTLGLTFFSEGVVANPFLRHDAVWKAFLRPNTGMGAVEDARHNEGEFQLISVLRNLEVPYKYTMNARMEDIKEEINQIERQVKFLLDKVRSVQSLEMQLCNAHEQVKVGLHSWYDAERLHVKTFNGRIYNENEPVYPPSMSPLSTVEGLMQMANRQAEQLNHNGEYISFTLLAILEFEMGVIESFRELFKIHEEMVRSIEQLASKIQKTEAGKASNRTELLQELKTNMDEKVACLNAFFKGFSFITLPLVARQRAIMFRRLLSAFSLSRYASYHMMQEACLTFFASIQMNSEVVMDELFRVLDTVDVKKCARVQLPTDERLASNGPETMSFLPVEFFGMNGLFDRALTLSRPEGSGGNSTPVVGGATHLFTQALASTNLATNSNAGSNSAAPNPPDSPNPLARRHSAVLKNQSADTNPFGSADLPADGYPTQDTEEAFV